MLLEGHIETNNNKKTNNFLKRGGLDTFRHKHVGLLDHR